VSAQTPLLPPAAPLPDPGSGLPPVPPPPPAIFPSQLEDDEGDEVVGIHDGRLFIRDLDDTFRLYPGGRARLDFYWSPGAPDLPETQAGSELEAHLFVRRVRLEMSGEIIRRLFFTFGAELGGQRIGSTAYAGLDTSRFAAASAHDGTIRPGEVSVTYKFRDWLNFTAGLYNAPFSMENRTREFATTFMERSIAIRGFVVPNEQELGLTLWGEPLPDRMLAYEVGIFSGDGPDDPTVDPIPDGIGRIFARPLATVGDELLFQQAQIGVSARYGYRDPERVTYDYPTIASNHGFVFWQPGYLDGRDRVTHVLPSGAQRAIGGELRVPFEVPTGAVFDIRAEAYYVANNTREAVDGFQASNTERFGRVNGVGWYAQISWWACCTDQLVNGEPGIFRPYTVNLGDDSATKRGLEIAAIASGIHADYKSATREGSAPDPNLPDSDITVYQFGGAIQYWYGWNFRAALNYMAYFAPSSGSPIDNAAVVPDNLHIENGVAGGGHVHHELGTRLAVTF
jgi:hypothetical protein